jgi:CHAT domain-containing protein
MGVLAFSFVILTLWMNPSVSCDSLRKAVAALPEDARAAPETLRLHAVHLIRAYRKCESLTFPQQVTLYDQELSYLSVLGRYTEALMVIDSFLVRFAHQADSMLFYQMYRWRGYIQYLRGDLPASVSDFDSALRHVPAQNPRIRALRLADIGTILQRMRAYDAAYTYYQQALREWHRIVSQDSLRLWTRLVIMSDLASLFMDYPTIAGRSQQESLEEARQLNAEVLRTLAQLHYPSALTRQSLALMTGFNQVLIESHLGRPRAALHLLDSLRHLSFSSHEEHWRFLWAFRRAQVLAQAGRIAEAEASFQEALRRQQDARHDDYRRALMVEIGRFYEAQGQLQQAEAFYRRAIRLSQTYLSALRTTEWARLPQADWYQPYRLLARVLLRQRRTQEAFYWLEASRALNLQAHRQAALQLRELSPAKRRLQDSLLATLSATLNRLSDPALSPEARAALWRTQILLEKELRDLIGFPPAPQPLSLTQLQRYLAAERSVVLSYILEDSLAGVFLVTPDTLRFFPLKISSDSLEALLHRVSPTLSTTATTNAPEHRYFNLYVLQQLYHYLVAPAAAYIPPGTRLRIIPDGILFQVPFDALVVETPGAYAYAQALYLMHRHPISISLNASLFMELTPAAVMPSAIMAFGRSRFAKDSRLTTLLPVFYAYHTLPDLPEVNRELRRLRQRFPAAQVFQEEEATEARFRQLAPRSQILHIASHVLLHPTASAYHAFLLYPAPQAQEDGILFLHELIRRPLAAALVVLSGCNTARGRVLPNEGLEGLQYAFQASGASSVVATLWLVEDQRMAWLIDRFYTRLQEGLPLDQALRPARIDFLATAPPEYQSPFYWASPVLFGKNHVLTFLPSHRASRFYFGFWILLLLVGVGLSILWIWRRHYTTQRLQ